MNSKLVKKLSNMVKLDQKVRFNFPYKYIVMFVNKLNLLKTKHIIKKHGYPSTDLIGIDGMTNFWMIVKNMDEDIELQKQCLENCKFQISEYAHLNDRIQINSGLDQKYGTVLNKPIKNLSETNRDRLKLGWGTVQDYIKDFNSNDELGRKLDLKINSDGSAEYLK